jgi:hypothetical protein
MGIAPQDLLRLKCLPMALSGGRASPLQCRLMTHSGHCGRFPLRARIRFGRGREYRAEHGCWPFRLDPTEPFRTHLFP